MKPVVSALNAWSWYVPAPATFQRRHSNLIKQRRYLPLCNRHPISSRLAIQRMSRDPLFMTLNPPNSSFQSAYVISMKSGANENPGIQSNNHAFTGSEGEPEDGAAVAASIYTAVIVYAVRHHTSPDTDYEKETGY